MFTLEIVKNGFASGCSRPCFGRFSPDGRADMDIHLLPSLARSQSPLPKCHVRYSCYCLRSPSLPPSLRARRSAACALSPQSVVPTCQGKRRKVTTDIISRRRRRRNCPSAAKESERPRPMRPPTVDGDQLSCQADGMEPEECVKLA